MSQNKFSTAAIIEPDGSGVTVMGKKFVPESQIALADETALKWKKAALQASERVSYLEKELREMTMGADAEAHFVDELNAENARLREALERIAKTDIFLEPASSMVATAQLALKDTRQVTNAGCLDGANPMESLNRENGPAPTSTTAQGDDK